MFKMLQKYILSKIHALFTLNSNKGSKTCGYCKVITKCHTNYTFTIM